MTNFIERKNEKKIKYISPIILIIIFMLNNFEEDYINSEFYKKYTYEIIKNQKISFSEEYKQEEIKNLKKALKRFEITIHAHFKKSTIEEFNSKKIDENKKITKEQNIISNKILQEKFSWYTNYEKIKELKKEGAILENKKNILFTVGMHTTIKEENFLYKTKKNEIILTENYKMRIAMHEIAHNIFEFLDQSEQEKIKKIFNVSKDSNFFITKYVEDNKNFEENFAEIFSYLTALPKDSRIDKIPQNQKDYIFKLYPKIKENYLESNKN